MNVSLLATFAATLAGFLLGAIWYGPLFGKAWMAEHGFTEESLKQNFSPAKTYGTTFLLSFLAAYVFGALVGEGPTIGRAAGAGFLIGLFWIGTSFATSYLFEAKSMRLWMINAGYHTVQFTLFGVAFGLLG